MNLFWRWGRRIKKWDDRLVARSVIFLLITSTAIGIWLVWRQNLSLQFIDAPVISKIATVCLFDVMLLVVVYGVMRRQRWYWEDLCNRQELARMLIDNMWYGSDARSNGRGDQDLITYVPHLYFWRRYSITDFPRLYYKRKKGRIYITVKITMGKYQDSLLKLDGKIETGLDCELIASSYKRKWQHYVFLCDVESSRIRLDEMRCRDGKLQLMRHLEWDYESHPHALIVGDTGSGKTYTLLSFIEAIAGFKAELVVIDAKNADLSGLEGYLPEVYADPDDIKEQVAKFYEDMLERMKEMKRCADYEPGKNYRVFRFPARFMVFDEYVAYLSMLPKKEAEEVISYLQKIILLGRQAGFFVVLSCQRPDAKYLPDGVRDQFGLRIALGAMKDSGYTMMFGTTEKQFVAKDIKGRGYIGLWDGVITEYYSPFVPPDHHFRESIKAVYAGAHAGGTSGKLFPASAESVASPAPRAVGDKAQRGQGEA